MATYIDGIRVEVIGTIFGGLPYLRIGDAGTTSQSLASEDDLMVTGKLEVDGVGYFDGGLYYGGTSYELQTDGDIVARGINAARNVLVSGDTYGYRMGANTDCFWSYEDADADAKHQQFLMDESQDSGNNVPAWIFGEHTNLNNTDLNLLDEVVQPHIVMMENAGKYTSATDATVDTGNKDELLSTGEFGSSVVGDIVRIISGSGTTIVGWYWITDVSGANDSVTLDRDCCTGSVTTVVFVAYHDFAMLTPRGVCLGLTDGAPSDSLIDIVRPGYLILDVGGAANGRLYWRPEGTTWRYVDATGGLSLTTEERIDPSGHEFTLGDEVKLVVDRINEDGSFHAEPIFAGRN